MAQTSYHIEATVKQVNEYVNLLERCGDLFENAPDDVRRELLLALFTKIVVHSDNGDTGVKARRSTGSEAVHGLQADLVARRFDTSATGTTNEVPHDSVRDFSSSYVLSGLNIQTLVEPRGIEPLTSCLQSRRSTN